MQRVASATPATGWNKETGPQGTVESVSVRSVVSVFRRGAWADAPPRAPSPQSLTVGQRRPGIPGISKIAGTATPDPRTTIAAIQSLPHCQARPLAAPSVTLKAGAAA